MQKAPPAFGRRRRRRPPHRLRRLLVRARARPPSSGPGLWGGFGRFWFVRVFPGRTDTELSLEGCVVW